MGDVGIGENSACVSQELLAYKEQAVRIADIVNSQPVLGGDTEWQKDPHKEEASAVSTFCTRGAPPPWPSPALPGPALGPVTTRLCVGARGFSAPVTLVLERIHVEMAQGGRRLRGHLRGTSSLPCSSAWTHKHPNNLKVGEDRVSRAP